MGDPCTSDAQCLVHGNLCYSGVNGNDSATGSSWCSFACTSDADCGSTNVCVEDNQAHFRCFPICDTTNDCGTYGVGISCQVTATIDALTTSVCSG